MTKLIVADKNLDRDALHDIVHEFYVLQIGRALATPSEILTPDMATQEFWDGVDDYFAPNGALVLAYGENNDLIGMGMMRKIRPDAAEFKRMYVRKAGRGHGLGRKMIDLRIQCAKDLGARSILAETLKASTTMHCIYRDMGFREISRNPESHAAIHFPDIASELLYFQLDL
jgi:GNAT superfamily N-acetyltransferase